MARNYLVGHFSSTMPQLLLCYVADEMGPAALKRCSRALWSRIWIENKTIHTAADIQEVSP